MGRDEGDPELTVWGDKSRIDNIRLMGNTDRVVGRIGPVFSVGTEEMFICSKNVEIDASDLTIAVLTFYSRRRKTGQVGRRRRGSQPLAEAKRKHLTWRRLMVCSSDAD